MYLDILFYSVLTKNGNQSGILIKNVNGGNKMASEMIEKIYDAEKRASLSVNDATDNARAIVEKAKLDAQNVKNELVKKAKLDADALVVDAREKAEQRIKNENSVALSEASVLCENVKVRESMAIEEIVKIIIPRQ